MNAKFRQELETLINCNNQEAGSDTPDFILADYLTDCLRAFDKAVTHRAYWYGHKTQPVPSDSCSQCGKPEVDAMTPRTVYACGSSDYDQRPGTFKQGDACVPNDKVSDGGPLTPELKQDANPPFAAPLG